MNGPAAAGLKTIEIMERDGVLEHVRAITPLFEKRLKALGELPLVGDARGMRLVGCVECVADTDADNLPDFDKSVAALIDRHCRENGLILRPLINMCVFSPPLIINADELNLMFDILEKGIRLTTEGLACQGALKIQVRIRPMKKASQPEGSRCLPIPNAALSWRASLRAVV